MQWISDTSAWVRKQSFLLSLLLAFALGLGFSSFFEPLANAQVLRNGIVATVLFLMALPLDTHSIGRTLRSPWSAVLGSVVNLGLLPLVAWALSRLLVGDMRVGLLVAAAVPSTLASGAVWTRRAGGDDTISLLITTITNVACFLVTPFWLFVTTGNEMSDDHAEKLARMPLRLIILVVLPMALAQLLRQKKVIGTWATRRKPLLSSCAQAGILSMVLIGATQCGLKLANNDWRSLGALLPMCAVALGLHVSMFWTGMRLARTFGFPRPQQIAVGVSGSQKTLMVGLDIAIQYFGGLAMLPMVAYHFIQLLADTVIADRLRRK